MFKTDEKEYLGKSVLFATGTKWRDLEIPGGKEFKHRGVNYCALCDAALYKNKTVCVVGGSDVAVRDALILSEYAKKVYIIYRKEKVRAEQANLELAEKNERIEIIKNTNVLEVKGKDFVESVVLDKKYKGKKELKLDGVFVAIGHVALSEVAEKLGTESYMVDNADELKAEWFEGKGRVGLTAGASAPSILVRQVVDRIKAFGAVSVRKMDGIEETVKFPLPKGLKTEL